MVNSLEIIGPYPPPFGGISVHILRMELFLKKEQIDYKIYNHGGVSSARVIATNKSVFWYIKYFFVKKGLVIHFHQFSRLHYPYFLFLKLCTKSKLIVTIHEEKILYHHKFLQDIIIWTLKRTKFSELISVSCKLSSFLLEKGVKNILIPAYVPPLEINFQKVERINSKDYFLYSIWKIDRVIASSIYNIELAFKLLAKIKDRYHMLFLVGSEKESDLDYLSLLTEKYGVADSLTILFEKRLIDYLDNCRFLVRTNNEDGYGVSLQEALDVRIPAIASNVCVRPKGTILFERDNLDDLCDKVDNIEKYWNENEVETPNYHNLLIEIYKKHLN